jgi:hypothetical protein
MFIFTETEYYPKFLCKNLDSKYKDLRTLSMLGQNLGFMIIRIGGPE